MNPVGPIRRVFSSVLLAAAFAFPIAGPGHAGGHDTLVIGLQAEPVTFDPTQIGDLNTSRVVRRIYEGLIGLKYGTYEIEPRLAFSWEVSEDELVYTFKLRPNVKFHDGPILMPTRSNTALNVRAIQITRLAAR